MMKSRRGSRRRFCPSEPCRRPSPEAKRGMAARERSMSLHSGFTLSISTVKKAVGGIEVDGLVYESLADCLYVRMLVPADGSTPQILDSSPPTGVHSGHDELEFCSHAVNLFRDHLSHCKLLEIHDLTSADDWHFEGPGHGHEYA